MEVEQREIREHMRQFAPFDSLPEEHLTQIANRVEVLYYKAGSTILTFGQSVEEMYYIRSGAVEISRRNGDFYNRLAEGEIFGQLALLMNRTVRFPARALEDTLLYSISNEDFQWLFETDEEFADFVEIEDRNPLQSALTNRTEKKNLMTAMVIKLVSRPPVTVSATVSVQHAAKIMSEEGVSSLAIIEGEAAGTPELIGILTDRDLRTRALAAGAPLETPITDIMSRDVICIEASDFIFEAMMLMLRHNVHHLPVMRRGKLIGIIALSDILRHESQSSLILVSEIFHKQSGRELARLKPGIRATFVRLVNEDANSRMIGSAIASIGRSISQRLLELGEAKLGPPPVPYCFLALGSMARDDQYVLTDQDNAMVIDDRFDPAEHDDYFKQLAAFVSDGLAECGYTYCTGGIMATNPTWRQPLKVWKSYFTDWIDKPNAQALLNSSIFFDLDGIYGETEFATTLQKLLAQKASKSNLFLACLARNALNRTPPLGFFRTFVMENDGKQNNTINLKRRGTAPLTDVIRVHALACGSTAQNSFDRLIDIAEHKVLGHSNGDDLRDALEFISLVRARHQAWDLENNIDPDNSVEPEALSQFERRNLKEAFQVLSNAQKYLRIRYQVGRAQ
ncbi:MAG: DUF294 nucleotidyltransferase-like domain-containing protein [Saccharospirillum sp.]|nr:DUF294 nucleotidyltransferase-like domain-containing protein [Saccharospirillum sp.]